jgi:hypothetical protein
MVLAVAGAFAQDAPTQAGPDIERQVKAAYLYKFGSYVEWPQGAFEQGDSPVQIGIVGDGMLADDLARLVAGRSLQGRKILVRKMQPDESLTRLNILFIGHSAAGQMPAILSALKGAPVLIVTESEHALAMGSMINFVTVNGKVRFEVAPKVATRGQLSISARLLAAAFKVVSEDLT